MNKTSIIITIVVLILLGFVFFLFSGGNTTPDTTSTENSGNSQANSGQDPVGSVEGGSRYVVYKEGVIEEAKGKRRVLYFYANWCPICKPADEDFRENSERIPEDVVVIRVNYNDSDTDQEEDALAEKYGVTYQHTFVQIDSGDNEITRWIGGQLNELLGNIE